MMQFFEAWSLIHSLIVQGFGLVLAAVAAVAAVVFLFIVLRKPRTTLISLTRRI